jgi:hypothetical protein
MRDLSGGAGYVLLQRPFLAPLFRMGGAACFGDADARDLEIQATAFMASRMRAHTDALATRLA